MKPMVRFYAILLSILAVSTAVARPATANYIETAQWPPRDAMSVRDTLTASSPGFLFQHGMVDNAIPAIRVRRQDGLVTTEWEVPFDRGLPPGARMPAIAGCGREVCLLLGGRFAFFTPDGEYIDSAQPQPPLPDAALVRDMAWARGAARLHLLLPSGEGISWHEYTTGGVRTAVHELAAPSGASSLFLAEAGDAVALGAALSNRIQLYTTGGAPVVPERDPGGTNLADEAAMQRALDAAAPELAALITGGCAGNVTDALASGGRLWIAAEGTLLRFTPGGVLEAAHAGSVAPDIPAWLSGLAGTMADGRTYWCGTNGVVMLIDASAAQPEHVFPGARISGCAAVLAAAPDSSNGWWIAHEASGGEQRDGSLLMLSHVPRAGGKVVTIPLPDEELQCVFASDAHGPRALVTRTSVYDLAQAATAAAYAPAWPHGLPLPPGSALSAAYDGEGGLLVCARHLTNGMWQSAGPLWLARHTGPVERDTDHEPLLLVPRADGGVMALCVDPLPRPRRHFYLQSLYPDGRRGASAQLVGREGPVAPCGLALHGSGMVFIGDEATILRFSPANAYADILPPHVEVVVKPAASGVCVAYDESRRLLSIHGGPPGQVPLAVRKRSLGRLGPKLFTKARAAMKRAGKLRRVRPSNVRIRLRETQGQPAQGVAAVLLDTVPRLLSLGNMQVAAVRAGAEGAYLPLWRLKCENAFTGTIDCASARHIVMRGAFEGTLRTWLGDAGDISVGGRCNNAAILSRGSVGGLDARGPIAGTLVRAGRSPAGFPGEAGRIGYVRSGADIADSTFIACADEGLTPGWSGMHRSDGESFKGSITELRARVYKAPGSGARGADGGSSAPGPRFGPAVNCTIVTRDPVFRLLVQLRGCTYILNGQAMPPSLNQEE